MNPAKRNKPLAICDLMPEEPQPLLPFDPPPMPPWEK
jgi:hypothetical protein